MTVGQYLSTSRSTTAVNLEVTAIGDILLRRGGHPADSDPASPLWAHRATGSFGGKADGGLGCVAESWWMRHVLEEDDNPVELTVKNGQWRVGRGRFCTMGKSPKPIGSWRVLKPFDARGETLRNASLQVLKDGKVVLASGGDVLWDSSSPP